MSVFPGSFWKEVLSGGASLGAPVDTLPIKRRRPKPLCLLLLLHGTQCPFAHALFPLTFHNPSVLVLV